ncbi:MAG: hypothetical protein GYB31_18555 [Bacteroidetes bacterium]|nr:hypothetical protein [Bacteroidota bacterium]
MSLKRSISVACFLFLSVWQIQGQAIYPFQHNRNTGMGGASTALEGIGAAAAQPAALTSIDRWSVALSGARYYWLPDIQTGNFISVLPTGAGNFGVQIQYYGFDAYSESSVALGYGRKLTENFSLGARFIYLHTRIPDYGAGGIFTFDLGASYKLNKDWLLGAYIYNPTQLEKVSGELLPTSLRLGASRLFGESATLTAEVEKTLAYDFRARVGLEYLPVPQLRILAGIQSNPSTFSLGIGWKSPNGLSIDLVQEYHLILGISPGLSVSYQPSNP